MAKLLVHDWFSGCLATAYESRSCFSVTMASRFEIVDEEYIEEVKDKIEKNTKNSTEYPQNVFKKWANERNFQAKKKYDSDVLDETLW